MNNELYHYGVKGMKWGVRRYRNSNGSLNDAGKKKVSSLEGKISKQAAKIDKRNAKIKKTAFKNEEKARKYEAKAAKQRSIASSTLVRTFGGGSRSTSYQSEKLRKAAKYEAIAERHRTKNETLRQKNVKAEKKIVKYNTKISQIDPKHKTVGKSYVDSYLKRQKEANDRAM